MGNSPPPCKIVTPKNFNVKLCTRDFVWEATHHTNFGYNRCSGASPNPLCDFVLTVLSFFARERAKVEPLNGLSRWLKRRGSAYGSAF